MRSAALLLLLAACSPFRGADPSHTIDPPRQAPLAEEAFELQREGLRLRVRPRASFVAQGYVLDTSRFLLARWEDVAPIDVTIAWGGLATPAHLAALDVNTENRMAHVEWDGPEPAPRALIQLNLANVHVVPANEEVEAKLSGVKRGRLVRLSGKLIDLDVLDEQGRIERRATTSLTRGDAGDGACEQLWLEELELDPPDAPPADE